MQTFMVREKATGSEFSAPEKVAESFSDLSEAAQESFWVLGLNTKNREICRKCMFVGGMNSSIVDPKIVYRYLLGHGVCCWIAVHNHPSGDPAPSEEDRLIHNKLTEAGRIIGIELLDSIVIGDEGKLYSHSAGSH